MDSLKMSQLMGETLFPDMQKWSTTFNIISDHMKDEILYQSAFLNSITPCLTKRPSVFYDFRYDGAHKRVKSNDVLQWSMNSFVVVKASDRKSEKYTFKVYHDSRKKIKFHLEFDYRHPGTSIDSDFENKRRKCYYHDERISPCNTKVAENLTAIVFANSDDRCELKSSYPMQIAVRTDDSRRAIMYDCFEYKPSISNALPSKESMKRFTKAFPEVDRFDYRDFLNGDTITSKGKRIACFHALAGDFAFSRVFRHRFNINDIIGIRLQKVNCTEPDDTCPAVLILELAGPNVQDPNIPSFCCRIVNPRCKLDKDWKKVDDFTPNEMASKATRHYIYANLEELQEFAAHLCVLCPRIEGLLSTEYNEANSLSSFKSNFAYASSPEYVEAGDLKPSPSKKQKKESSKKKRLTMEEVNNLMEEKGLGNVNDCLKRGILLGYIKIKNKNKDSVIYRGHCLNCNGEVQCTLGDASRQGNIGDDYEDGNEGGAVKCHACSADYECAYKMYITCLCKTRPFLSEGKFHNHCSECPEFGTCLGDYRDRHCFNCKGHYFGGGFCDECGADHGEKYESMMDTLTKPLPSCWNGVIEVEDAV